MLPPQCVLAAGLLHANVPFIYGSVVLRKALLIKKTSQCVSEKSLCVHLVLGSSLQGLGRSLADRSLEISVGLVTQAYVKYDSVNLPKRQIDHMEDCHNIDDVRADQDENESELPCWMFDESVVKPFNNWSTTNELKFTDPVTVRRVYALAGAIHDVFTSTGIHYWTSGGTTLGCVRHNGLIPWDDDLDLCIYRTDEHKLTSEAKRLLDDKGFEVTEAPSFGHRVFHKTDSDRLPDCHLHRYPFCDIFVMKTCGGDKCCIENRCGRTLWPNEVYNTKDTKKTERRPFGDLLLNCPANSEDYLSRNYGEEWRTEGATQSYDHTTRSMVKPVRFLLGPEHYQPAKPFSWFWIQHCMSQNYTGGGWEGVLPCISYIGTLRPTWYHFKGSLS